MRFVLHSSVPLQWLYRAGPAPGQRYAEQVLANFIKNEAWVPSLWWLDLAEGISKAERDGLVSQAESEQFLRLLQPLPISERLMPGPQLLQKALDLSRQHGGSVNRAAYLALALQESIPLASLDPDLQQVAQRCGIQPYFP